MIQAPDTSLAEIAARLRRLRECLGKTQVQICRDTGIATTTWSNYEKASRRISIENARRLRIIFGVGAEWIYWGDPTGLPGNLLTVLGPAASSPLGALPPSA